MKRNLGVLFMRQEKLKAAEAMFRESLATYERVLGVSDAQAAETAKLLAAAYFGQGRTTEAAALYRRAGRGDVNGISPDSLKHGAPSSDKISIRGLAPP